ncbi:hypothetical protein MPTK1_5g18980 [Marchantia polymorpha subsp. ruderalis]|uniref:Uncharacterized protein n=2 Tax=Marchantia polymorpha TaxID=3197 RepID=A0AAF6BJX2_MARPO|nr:hypothetical protein MARPO_0073s0045 [Marchantia polymorpha]BBN12306.1 hypothetical protein Mp_5g18980 [Marchantia polymorpha subsp. ruderalis]|eukprot:PTQ35171.1 hypothetical protein MARPO_0073s0045 [Marchantia polymorpha]
MCDWVGLAGFSPELVPAASPQRRPALSRRTPLPKRTVVPDCLDGPCASRPALAGLVAISGPDGAEECMSQAVSRLLPSSRIVVESQIRSTARRPASQIFSSSDSCRKSSPPTTTCSSATTPPASIFMKSPQLLDSVHRPGAGVLLPRIASNAYYSPPARLPALLE